MASDVFRFINNTHHADSRRRVDCPGRVLVVQADITASYRRTEYLARLGQATHALLELPKQLRIVRITEVQIIGRTKWPRTGADKVPCRLGDGSFAALIRVEVNMNAIAVHRHRQEFVGDVVWRRIGREHRI